MTTEDVEIHYYISVRFLRIPRYQIDQELLERGFNAKAIDANWQSVLQEYNLDEKPPTIKRKRSLIKRLGLVAALGLVVWGILSFTVFYVDPNRVLFDTVPDYPYATKLSLDGPSAAFLLNEYGNGRIEFKVYVSTDNKDQIQQYYEQYADRYHYDHNSTVSDYGGFDEWFVSGEPGSSYTSMALSLNARGNMPISPQLSDAMAKGNIIILEKGYFGHCCG